MFGKASVLVVGCGDYGSTLASSLSRQGFNVTVVDMTEEAFDSLDDDFDGDMVTGDGTASSLLRESGIAKASCVVAATGDDATNFLIAEIASEIYGVEHVLPRIEDEMLISILGDMNVKPICPHLICINEFFRLCGLKGVKAAAK